MSQKKTCAICGTPLPGQMLGGKCPACLRQVALMEPSLLDDTIMVPQRAATPSRRVWEPPSVEEMSALLPAGAYTVESLIGRGGMGAVYKGTQISLKRTVAVKLMRQDQNADFRERFLREAHTLARLNHPGIVNVIDCGEVGADLLYIIMEFVDGADLMEVIRSGGLTQERTLHLLPQICEALQFAHDHGIVHRDIKPSNILLTRDGRVKVADFGLAKALDPDSSVQTHIGTGLGTPDYAAPEQFTPGAEVDHRADIYALGVMIYQMITGQLPRGAWKPPSEKADVDAHWDHIVSRALQTDPHERYASVSEVRTEISKITPVTSAARKDSAHQKSRKNVRTLLFSAAVCLVLAVGGYFGWEKFKHAPPNSPAPGEGYPTQARWVDATQEVRDQWLKAQAAIEESDGWLCGTKNSTAHLAARKEFRDVAVRVVFSGAVSVFTRNTQTTERNQAPLFTAYHSSVNSWQYGQLFTWDDAQARKLGVTVESPKLTTFDPSIPHELVVTTVGDLTTLWLDGRRLLTRRDSTLQNGGISVYLPLLDQKPGIAPRIKKVEYADLGGTPMASVALALPPPAPIRLWDAADKIPKEPGVTWEDDALRLDNVPVSHIFPATNRVAVKASIRVNPDTEGVNFHLREGYHSDAGTYLLNVNIRGASFGFQALQKPDKSRYLDYWKAPRQYRPGEWLPVELRVADGVISVLLDGKPLRTVHDSAFSNFTAFTIWGTSYAHFRDIEVVPLGSSLPNQPQAAPAIPAVGTSAIPVTVMVTDIPQLPVPKPAAWVDATPQVREVVVQAGAGTVQGDWLVLSKPYYTALPDGKVFRDAVVRMIFKGAAGLALRYASGTRSYQAALGEHGLKLYCWDAAANKRALFDKSGRLEPDFDLLAEHDMVMAVEGDLISAWLDGRLMLSQRDSNISQGGIGFFAASGSNASLHPHVKKVEYGDLGGTPAVPAPIRLWDTPEKVPARVGRWENNALRLHSLAGGFFDVQTCDVIFRARLRMNPDSDSPSIAVRLKPSDSRDKAGRSYVMGLALGNTVNLLLTGGSSSKILGSWPLPRKYDADEWLPLELRAVGDQLTAVAEGHVLGTVRDATLSEPGGVQVWAKANSYWRDIEVVPLGSSLPNQPQAASAIPVTVNSATPLTPTVTTAETAQRPVPKPAAWVDATAQVRDAVVQAGAGGVQGDWLVLSRPYSVVLPGGKVFRDAVVRMTFKGAAGLGLRYAPGKRIYSAMLARSGVNLHCWDGTEDKRVLFDKYLSLEPNFDLRVEHELVLAVEGDLISAWLDGRLMLSQRDSSLSQGGIVFSFAAPNVDASLHPHIKKAEYAELGGTKP